MISVDIFLKKKLKWSINRKNCSVPLVIKEMLIKTTIRYHLTLTMMATMEKTTNVGKDMKTLESSYIVCGNVKWCTSDVKNILEVPQNVKYIG